MGEEPITSVYFTEVAPSPAEEQADPLIRSRKRRADALVGLSEVQQGGVKPSPAVRAPFQLQLPGTAEQATRT